MQFVIAESVARRSFKNSLGDVNHAYATWIVALANLPAAGSVIPADLALVWHPKNVERSKLIAHDAAKRAVLGLVVSSFDEFIDCLRARPFLTDEAFRQNLTGSVGERLGACQAELETLDETSCLMDLLIYWRNRLVHGSKSNLDPTVVAQLRVHADGIASEYAGCDVELAVTHSRTRELPSNVEILALILAAQRFVRRVDRLLIERLNVETYLYECVGHFLLSSGKSVQEVWCWKPERRETWTKQVVSHYGIVEQEMSMLEYHSPDFTAAIRDLSQSSLTDVVRAMGR